MTDATTRRTFLALCAGAWLMAPARGFAQPSLQRVFRGRNEEDWLGLMATRPVVRMVSRHSSTAIVYQLDLGDGIEIGFKAERPHQETWWRHEIISYRFARLLGIEGRVPPVVGRRVPASIFGRYAVSDRLVTSSDGMIRGSASVWMPVLRGEQLHTGDARREWTHWMTPGVEIPTARRERARHIAVLLVFDWLMANFDRWNCCNVPVDEHNNLVYRDNDAGWAVSVMNRVSTPDGICRLPRALWERLQRVDGAALRAEVARDPMSNEHLIGRAECAAYDRRRVRLLRYLQDQMQQHGESAVLAWP